jgi:hypothetical protein
VSVDPIDVDRMRWLARILGVDLDDEGDVLGALATELDELLAEGRVYAKQELGDLSPSVQFQPLE